jgi:hypothetical protein
MLGGVELSDEGWQIAVLSRVLLLHPAFMSVDELQREMLAGRQGFSEVDAHDRAVGELIASGLLRREGDSILATRAAVRFYLLHS